MYVCVYICMCLYTYAERFAATTILPPSAVAMSVCLSVCLSLFHNHNGRSNRNYELKNHNIY